MAISPHAPTQIGGGKLGPTTYRTMSPSQNIVRDTEYWIPYDQYLLDPNTQLDYGMTFARCMNPSIAMEGPIAEMLQAYVFMGVVTEGQSQYLVFAANTQPSLGLTPSSSSSSWKQWQWPAVITRQPAISFLTNSGNFNGVLSDVEECIIEQATRSSLWIVDDWWTAAEWPSYMTYEPQPVPGLVVLNYHPLYNFSINCLHPTIDAPPLTGITQVRGQPQVVNIQGKRFLATTFKTLGPIIYADDQEQIRGRWYRKRITIEPPEDFLTNPPRSLVYSS